mgnify:CR=1 FL=1
METDYNCIYCNQPTSLLYNCRLCNSCKSVMNFSLDTDKLFDEIKKCLNSIQKHIDIISSDLYKIENKYINNEHLSPEEQRIFDFCSRFQYCKNELNYMISDNADPRDKRFKENLYILLKLSNDFSDIFKRKCHILSIPQKP